MCFKKDISIYLPLRKRESKRETFLEEITTLFRKSFPLDK